jgi:predicted nucleotidyltransferase component of viral defense system
MRLHENTKLFSDSIRSASKHLNIIPVFIEKDYWITLVLKRLAESKYSNNVVFKGGTSLSKAYDLIHRFSEDIDLAIIEESTVTGNPTKILNKENVERDIKF